MSKDMIAIATICHKHKTETHLIRLTDLMIRNRRTALALMYKALVEDKRKIKLYKLVIEIEEQL